MISGARVLTECMKSEGIRHVFGIPGTQTLAVWDEIRSDEQLTPIFLRNEQNLSLAAKGYFQSGRGLAAVVTVPGPGATNLVTGVIDALADSCGMLLVTADVPPDHFGRGCVHDCDLAEIFRPIVKGQIRVEDPDQLATSTSAAIEMARSGRPGPVQLLVSGQMLRADHDVEIPDKPGLLDGVVPETLPSDQIAAAATKLSRAERPLVYAGGGAAFSGAAPVIRQLAHRLGAPVVTSLSGRGAIPEDDPLSVGVPFFPGVKEIIGAADAAVVVGTRFSEFATATWEFDLPEVVVRIDIDPEALQFNYAASDPITGDAAAVLRVLLDCLGEGAPADWGDLLKGLRRSQEDAITTKLARERRRGGRIHPMVLTEHLRAAVPRGTAIAMDGSATESWLMHTGFPVFEPLTFLLSEVSQELGAALPVAMGAAAALGEPVLCVSGDGGLMYNAPELSAAVQHALPVKVVVFDDGGWYNSVRQFQDAFFDGRYIGTSLLNPDWVQLVGAMDVPCEIVTDEHRLSGAFETMMRTPGPAMVVVEIDREPIAPRFEVRIQERRKSL